VIHLLDGNVLIALTVRDHIHHDVVRGWFGAGRTFATSPTTQGTLLRFMVREGAAAKSALSVLAGLTGRRDHTFWPDLLPYDHVRLAGVVGHRQVTDAYIASLADESGGRVATLDRGLAAARADVVDLISDA
jgi:predicted nucleic acid-binding protein